MENKPLSLLWLRRDLRLHDHAPLFYALKSGAPVQPVFIFDSEILARFSQKNDRRLSFIASRLAALDEALSQRGGGLLVLHGKPESLIPKLADVLGAGQVFTGEDYEPASRERDAWVARVLGKNRLQLCKDHLIFSPEEIVKDDGTPYKVFTPYSKAWHAKCDRLSDAAYVMHDKDHYADAANSKSKACAVGIKVLDAAHPQAMLEEVGYTFQKLPLWPQDDGLKRLKKFTAKAINGYDVHRNFPAEHGTSELSPYLRFGMVSISECLREARKAHNPTVWIKELIWREFYAMILYHYPHSISANWNPDYGAIKWSRSKAHFKAWQEGMTGYPIVDAAMRQLLQTGWMHNRARMIVASFLTKDLRIDWREGEEHFAQYLMDYEASSNVGGWQWAASTGTDAQPWFRIFNPTLQSEKFDPKGEYIRYFVPELKEVDDKTIHAPEGIKNYPAPIVDHKKARDETLAMFKSARS